MRHYSHAINYPLLASLKRENTSKLLEYCKETVGIGQAYQFVFQLTTILLNVDVVGVTRTLHQSQSSSSSNGLYKINTSTSIMQRLWSVSTLQYMFVGCMEINTSQALVQKRSTWTSAKMNQVEPQYRWGGWILWINDSQHKYRSFRTAGLPNRDTA